MPDQLTTSRHDMAIIWHLRIQDPNFDAWSEFANWLESDPENNSAYEAVADSDHDFNDELQALPKKVMAANDDIWTPRVQRRWRIAAATFTAALIAVAGFQLAGPGNSQYSVQTGPGEIRSIALAGGDSIALNGNTRIILDTDNPRFANLEAGEARFEIKHDPRNPFTVELGDQKVIDVGTVFNIVREHGAVDVEVAHGEVRYEGFGKSAELIAGSTLSVNKDGRLVKGRKPVNVIGTWHDGELVYEGATLDAVARDLSRTSGIEIVVTPNIAARRFSGVIQTRGSKDDLRSRVEVLLGVKVEASKNGWTLAP
jgi:transmembrane sensor